MFVAGCVLSEQTVLLSPSKCRKSPSDATPVASSNNTAHSGRLDHCMVRLVDDFLVVTSSRTKAEGILRCLHGCFSRHMCTLNPKKTKLNFRIQLETGSVGPNVYEADDGARFVPWCGLLINAETLEIQADYRRYLGQHVRSSLTLILFRRPGEFYLSVPSMLFVIYSRRQVLALPTCI